MRDLRAGALVSGGVGMMPGTRTPLHVHVPCQARNGDRLCQQAWNEHVHQPLPCSNGKDYAHHDFSPPKWLSLEVAGKRRRLKVA
jgi:hypothetical protein